MPQCHAFGHGWSRFAFAFLPPLSVIELDLKAFIQARGFSVSERPQANHVGLDK